MIILWKVVSQVNSLFCAHSSNNCNSTLVTPSSECQCNSVVCYNVAIKTLKSAPTPQLVQIIYWWSDTVLAEWSTRLERDEQWMSFVKSLYTCICTKHSSLFSTASHATFYQLHNTTSIYNACDTHRYLCLHI